MTISELYEILKTTGLPVAYSHFNSKQKPPFIVYLLAYTNNAYADNKTYAVVNHWQIELYTATKDIDSEEKIENALQNFAWQKSEEYIEQENVFQIIYEIEEF